MDRNKEIINFLDLGVDFYEDSAPNNANLPYCVISDMTSSAGERFLCGGRSSTEFTTQIMLNATEASEAKEISDKIFNKLDGLRELGKMRAFRVECPIHSTLHNVREWDGIYQVSIEFSYIV